MSSVYFTGKNDQGDYDFSIFEDYRHNYNFTYFDEIINNSVITEEDTLYVTLEPCFHTDSSPSCCAELLKTPIKNIVIGDIDIDIRTNGKSIELLKKNKKPCKKKCHQKEARRAGPPKK